ncbi:MAG: hypothetical protein CSA65_06900 [Proteobacteria bacterium]|nr:MAG: hypothetical protein CSA65_06900 [Pseudomonadota bacterium]
MPVYAEAARCRACDQLSYPTVYYCPRCGGRDFAPERLRGEGTLLTWTRLHALPRDIPERFITLGVVELEMGLRATGRLAIAEPQLGQRVRVTIGSIREIDGEPIEGLVFVAAAQA